MKLNYNSYDKQNHLRKEEHVLQNLKASGDRIHDKLQNPVSTIQLQSLHGPKPTISHYHITSTPQ